MYKYLFALVFGLPFISNAQVDSIITYTEVVRVDSVSKDELYKRARAWFNDAFKSSKDVIQVQDKETGEISGKGIIKSVIELHTFGKTNYAADYTFTIKVLTKDGRYKYEISNFDNYILAEGRVKPFGVLTSSTTSSIKHSMVKQSKMDESWKSAKENIDAKVQILIASLKKAIAASSFDSF